jgi:hypothetical protein
VHALIGQDWQWCRAGDEDCPEPITTALREAEARRKALKTPVASP